MSKTTKKKAKKYKQKQPNWFLDIVASVIFSRFQK